MEDEGGGQISLDMRLLSALEQLKFEKELSSQVRWVVNQQFVWESNHNYGGRIIVPDAQMLEGNLSTYLSWNNRKIKIETGIGANARNVQTFATRSLNDTPEEPVQPFNLTKPSANGMIGFVFTPIDSFALKANLSTGFRSGNLAELSSNGLHEGVYRYEIGDPNLLNEQNANGEISVDYENDLVEVGVAIYYNRFFNYIYLAPTNETFFGFPVFRFKQNDATLYGGEATLNIKFTNWLSLHDDFALTFGELDATDDTLLQSNYLPFIPPPRNKTSLRFEKKLNGLVRNVFIEPEFDYAFNQNRPAQFETTTSAYALLNVYASADLGQKNIYTLSLSVTNVLNESYADHLSRLKYYGLLNMGRNFTASIKMRFDLKK